MLGERLLLGMLTPSSNTVLEPLTTAMLAETPDITAHFGRFRVTEIALDDAALGQFDVTPLLDSARLLADARVSVIAWNGTSGGWLGFDSDRRLCAAIRRETGAQATTSTLALADALVAFGARNFALVSPYLDDVQAKVIATFAAEGHTSVAERHLAQRDNFSFSTVTEEQIEQMIRDVACAKPDAIAIYCTNLRGPRVAARLEAELDVPILDSISVAVWKSLILGGADPTRIKGWGRLFSMRGPIDPE